MSSSVNRRFHSTKLSSLLLVAIAAISLAASCGNSGKTGAGSAQAASQAEQQAAAGAAAEAEAREAALAQERIAEEERAKAEAASSGQAQTESERAAEAARSEAARIAAIELPAPTLSGPEPGVYAAAAVVSASTTVKEARLVYTLDGSTPGARNGKPYTGPVSIATSAVLRVAAYVPGGRTSPVASAEYAIGEVCAAPGGSGDGRRGHPFGDIGAAVAKARALGLSSVKLSAAGEFRTSLELTAPITLSGGWKADFSALSAERTVIRGPSVDGSSKKSPAYALSVRGVKADSGVRLERLDLRGGEATYSAGLLVSEGASPVVAECRADGGTSSYGYGVAVMSGAAPRILQSRLSGGDGATSYGLSVDSAKASVASSFLLAGSGAVGGYGLSGTDARIRVASSVVAGSAANVSYGAAFYNCKESALESCTVIGGSGRDAAGVFVSACDPAIENCILSAYGSGKSYGIIDNYGDSAPSRLASCAFIGCSGGLYYDADTKAAYAALSPSGALVGPDGKGPARPKAAGCAIGAFELNAADDYRTPAGAALPAAKPLAGDAATDILGKKRAEPWTVGAYQL